MGGQHGTRQAFDVFDRLEDDKLAKPNYQYEKRQKEMAKKKKQDEKRQRKLEKGDPEANAVSDRAPGASKR